MDNNQNTQTAVTHAHGSVSYDVKTGTKTYTPPVGGFTPEQKAGYEAAFKLAATEQASIKILSK